MKQRLFAELLGTFVIVFAPVATASTRPELVVAALASGLSVLVMIYALAPVSGAHFNPAVTLMLAGMGKFDRCEVPAYIVAQVAGGVLAALVCRLMFGAAYGATEPGLGIVPAMASEFVLSFVLMFVIASCVQRESSPFVPALVIGVTIPVCVFAGGKVSGASMNPARSLGPALLAGGAALQSVWLYLLVPPLGALCGAKAHAALVRRT